MDKKYTILAIDDTITNLKYLQSILSDSYSFKATPDPNIALNFIKAQTPDLILLDIGMPEIDGYTLCQTIKNNHKFTDIPIIFISGYDDVDHKIKAFENGGVDYITKPFEAQEVLARIKTQIKLHMQKKQIDELLIQQDLFIKKIMHEINTPSSIISLNCDALIKKVGLFEEINSIKASSKTLSTIYADINYLVKKTKTHYQTTSIELSKFIIKRIHFFDELSKVKDILIDFIPNNSLQIDINENELERIIDNTLSNAIKYSHPSSHITIEINKNLLSISDEGIGIENPQEIFTSYYQDNTKNIGFGLGLSIVNDICIKHNISINVISVLNQGTNITYDFTSIKDEK
ncbi:MAG TPA: hybrid sensor histidine kinase/response regulator [Arcobacter sp.]|jgi:DNA-binding response OmpR family regulator|nr:hybrid sensor histidine kinase/response regulator [Arcobacter sp.]